MAHDEQGRRARLGGLSDVGEELGNVGQHLGRGAREAALGGLADGLAPAALVEAVDGDAGEGEGREEAVVSAQVVAEAVDEDEFGDGRGGVVGLVRGVTGE